MTPQYNVTHKANTSGRDFFVGDIHGQWELLQDQLDQVAFDKNIDRLFSVGDLIDRGPESKNCLSLVFEPWFHAVLGNHEMMAASALIEGRGQDLWFANGGNWMYDHNAFELRLLMESALEHLPVKRTIETVYGNTIGLVHAEPGDHWSDEDIDKAVWSRTRVTEMSDQRVGGIDYVVVGHTPVDLPAMLGNVIYIDTGAYATGSLTIVEARDVIGIV
ncbi:metallophosphoesterase [Halomonas sp. DP5N14-9]|uniref:metallophosphoesterase n=1 Tax=Halomonas sp. DP5N14-9 TaxID=2859075 RepID=UPI001C990E72|nr:metallophosphoesterase [Halomonas sp. DP5N14-9]MBY5942326.1 metallophosphoesterase [Halomonas sp. DP5N14-9]